MNRLIGSILTGVLITIPAPVLADCVDGVRQATAREAEHFKRVYAQLKAALPPPPPDWSMASIPDRAYGSTCQGVQEDNVWVDLRTVYTYRMPKEQADRNAAEMRKLAAELEALEKLPPEAAKERQGWMDKYSEATRAARQADKDGNRALAKQKYSERDEYDRQANAVRARHKQSIEPTVGALRARMAELNPAPREVRVRLVANDSSPVSASERNNVSEIVVGTIPPPGKKPAFKVAGVHVLLEGPAPQREALAAAFDRAKLQQALR